MPTKTILYFLAILLGTWSADAAEVALLPQTHAKGSLVLLGDVAKVKSADTEHVARLERVELFPAPAQHRSKLMHLRELVELLVLHGINLDDLEFTGARTTRIYAAAQESKVVAGGVSIPLGETTEMMVVARRGLARGAVIRDTDIEMQPIDPRANTFQIATARQSVVGMEAISPIHEGQVILLTQLRKPLLVKRGEVIRVRARAAGVQVTTTARATQDGSLGDIILVQSLENREQYPTHVTGLQQVEVNTTGVVAADPARPTAPRPNLLTEE